MFIFGNPLNFAELYKCFFWQSAQSAAIDSFSQEQKVLLEEEEKIVPRMAQNPTLSIDKNELPYAVQTEHSERFVD